MPDKDPAPISLTEEEALHSTAALLGPLPGDPRRQAVHSIEGTIYQAWWSIDAWLQLTNPDEIIYLEGAEDFDIVTSERAIAVQVKKYAASISLGTAKAQEALENFWSLSRKAPTRTINLHYLTTSSIATEQGANFNGLSGIEAWRAAQTNPELAAKIATFLIEKLPSTSLLRAFLADAPPNVTQEHLIRRFHWLTDQPDIDAVKRSVNDRICLLLSNMRRSMALSTSVQKYLESHFWETIVKPSPPERCLTQAELLRQVEAATTAYLPIPIDQLPYLIGSAPPGLNLLSILLEKSPKPPDPLLRRPVLTARLEEMVRQRRTVLLTGSVFKGKTTLAQLVASALCPEAWWINLTEREPVQVDTILLALARRIESGDCPSLIIIDDLNVSSNAHRVYKNALALVLHRAKSAGRSFILTAQGASSESAVVQDFTNVELLDVPELSAEETATLCHEHGCPDSLMKLWGNLVNGTTSGHPKLVQVRIVELASRGWPKPGPDDLLAPSSAVKSVRLQVRQLLSESVPIPVAEFVYMISECSVLMHRTVAIRLAESIEGIRTAGDVIDSLAGKWLERIEGQFFRATALLKGIAAEVWSTEKLKQVHIRLHDAIRAKGTLSPWEGAALLFHAFIGRDTARLTHTAMHLQTIEDRNARHEVERQLLWLPLVALEAGQSLVDHALASVIIRQLQFRVASTLDSGTLPQICERWTEDIERIPQPEAKSMMSAVMWFSIGFSQSLNVPLKPRLQAIAGIGTIPDDIKNIQEQTAQTLLHAQDVINAGIPGHGTTAQMMFLFLNRSICDSPSLEQLLQWLDQDASPELRRQFDALLGWPVTQAIGAFIQGAWSSKHEEIKDWEPWLTLLERIDDYAKRRASPGFGCEGAKAKAIILTEYLERSNDALTVLDTAVKDFGPSAVLLEQRANVLFHTKDDEKVLAIWAELSSNPANRAVLDPFAYRRAGISAARLGRWDEAEQIFLTAAAPLTSGPFGPTKFGLQVDAALAASLRGDQIRAAQILVEAVLGLPAEAATEGDLAWDAVQRVSVEVYRTIEKSYWKQKGIEPKVKVGDASSPTLRAHKAEAGQKARNEMTRIQVLHLATTLGVGPTSIASEIEALASSKYMYVRWLLAEARLALSYSGGAGSGFIPALIAYENAYVDFLSKRETLSPVQPDEEPPSDLKIAPETWFGLLAGGVICATTNLLPNLRIWLEESIQAVGLDAPLTIIISEIIDGASVSAQFLEDTLQNEGNSPARRCGAAAILLGHDSAASKTFRLQRFLTSALVCDKSFARQELCNLHVGRRFAGAWRVHASNRFQFSSPNKSVPKLLGAIDEVVTGRGTLKTLLLAASNALGERLESFIERVL